ncbi:diguanylate cyclase, partial [Amphibiibacter pelophylacis]
NGEAGFIHGLTRRLFMWMMSMGAAVFFFLWVMGMFTEINPVTRALLPMNAIILCGTTVLMLVAPQRQELWIQVAVGSLAVLLPVLLFLGLQVQPLGREIYFIAPIVLWMPLPFMIVFFLFETRKAIRWCVLLFIANIAAACVPVFILLPDLVRTNVGRLVITSLLSQPVYMAVLIAFSALRTRHIQTEAVATALRRAAETDGLTGLLNRRRIQEDIQALLDRLAQGGPTMGLIMLDVDHFKRINDSHGHSVGDDVLVKMAAILEGQLRPDQRVARWGGEEFMILVPGASLLTLNAMAERLRMGISTAAWPKGVAVTSSFGVAEARFDENYLGLLNRVDAALYEAKKQGRNCVVADGLATGVSAPRFDAQTTTVPCSTVDELPSIIC